MSEPTTRPPPPAKISLGIGAAWFIGLTAALALMDGLLARMPLPRALLGALVVSVAVDRAGSRDKTGTPLVGAVGVPFALGTLTFVVPLLLWIAIGRADVHFVAPGTMFLVAILVVVARAFETEMLLRVLSFEFASRAKIPLWPWVAFAAVASPARAGLLYPFLPIPALLSLALGLAAALLHARGADARRNVAFTAGFGICAGPIAQGGLLDVHWRHGELRPDALASGGPAMVAAAVAVVLALVWFRRQSRTPSPPGP